MKVLIIVLSLCSVSWCDELPTIEKFFNKFGQFEFKDENGYSVVKSYYASRDLKVTWLDAFKTCKAFDMDLVELPTEAEADYFLNLLTESNFYPSFRAFIGASYVGVDLNEFYWMTTGQRINYTLKWGTDEPNYNYEHQFLAIWKEPIGYLFNYISDTRNCEFICQRINNTMKEPVVNPVASKLPQCKPETLEWFPHPYSCEKFFICFHGNPIEKSCAPNLQFNVEQGKCIISELPCCPLEDDVMNPLFFSDLNDCTKYSVCYSGKAIEKSCGEGLFFDVKNNWCTVPEDVTCDPRTINAPIITPPVPIDTSICDWYGNVTDSNGIYLKSLCYYDRLATHDEALEACQSHGMRLLRIEDSLVENVIFEFLAAKLGRGTGGVFHVSGKNINGLWYHDDNTRIYENLTWQTGNIPQSSGLALFNYNTMSFDAFSNTKLLHAICEFKR